MFQFLYFYCKNVLLMINMHCFVFHFFLNISTQVQLLMLYDNQFYFEIKWWGMIFLIAFYKVWYTWIRTHIADLFILEYVYFLATLFVQRTLINRNAINLENKLHHIYSAIYTKIWRACPLFVICSLIKAMMQYWRNNFNQFGILIFFPLSISKMLAFSNTTHLRYVTRQPEVVWIKLIKD